MRLIDADALMKEGYCLERIYQKDSTTMVLEKRNIENVPIVDAVPVVRCRDCKHRYDDGYCEVWGDSFYYWEEFDEVPEDMFCGHGERRENETAD